MEGHREHLCREKSEEQWPFSMELPCRVCTDKNEGQEVWKPLSAFTTSRSLDAVWQNTIAKGQDLVCFKCRHTLKWGPSDAVILCDACNVIRARKEFNAAMQRDWEAYADVPMHCKSCSGEGKKHSSAEVLTCAGPLCGGKQHPEYHFEEAKLVELRARGASELLAARCARCVVKTLELGPEKRNTCHICKKTKPYEEFNPVNLKQWLTGARTEHKWTCFECLFPPCCLCPGDARPLHGIKHNALVDGKYYCMQHRYPPCSGPGCTSGPNGGLPHEFLQGRPAS